MANDFMHNHHNQHKDQGIALIILKHVSFNYKKHPLYQDFNVQIDQPGLYGLFGRNGSGKSTLFKLIAGLLFRKTGNIKVVGFDPQQRNPDFLSSIYFVPEEFHLPNLSCDQLATLQAAFYPRFSHDILSTALSVFQIGRDTAFEEMSLGEKKKAVMAFALATRTPVLLLDEPTNGLDIVGRDQFRQLIQQPEQTDRLVLISTHQAHDLEKIISRVLFIDQGRLALSESMDALADKLHMGVTSAEQLSRIADVVYQQEMGGQIAYIAKRLPGQAQQPVQLELLYRALSHQRDAILEAIRENQHV